MRKHQKSFQYKAKDLTAYDHLIDNYGLILKIANNTQRVPSLYHDNSPECNQMEAKICNSILGLVSAVHSLGRFSGLSHSYSHLGVELDQKSQEIQL